MASERIESTDDNPWRKWSEEKPEALCPVWSVHGRGISDGKFYPGAVVYAVYHPYGRWVDSGPAFINGEGSGIEAWGGPNDPQNHSYWKYVYKPEPPKEEVRHESIS